MTNSNVLCWQLLWERSQSLSPRPFMCGGSQWAKWGLLALAAALISDEKCCEYTQSKDTFTFVRYDWHLKNDSTPLKFTWRHGHVVSAQHYLKPESLSRHPEINFSACEGNVSSVVDNSAREGFLGVCWVLGSGSIIEKANDVNQVLMYCDAVIQRNWHLSAISRRRNSCNIKNNIY